MTSLSAVSLFWNVPLHSLYPSILARGCDLSIRRLRHKSNKVQVQTGLHSDTLLHKQTNKQTTSQQSNVIYGEAIPHYSLSKPDAFLYVPFVCMHMKNFCTLATYETRFLYVKKHNRKADIQRKAIPLRKEHGRQHSCPCKEP